MATYLPFYILNQYLTDNVTGRHKKVCTVYKPANLEEVQELVCSARKSGIPLYPVSTGFNWGYSSRSPVVEGCALLDLSGMNRILNAEDISLDNPVAVIEPGVTQGQLYEFLQRHCPQLGFNVTGSGRETSIIGNALDRGVGYDGPRSEDIFGLEIVTGTGEVLHTGFRRLGENSPLTHTYPYGLGPMLDGLFLQGNFGIVTSACFQLIPKRPCEIAVSLSLKNEQDLPAFIDELVRLRRENLITTVTHIANRARSHSTLHYGIATYLENRCSLTAEAILKETERALNIVAGEWACLASLKGSAAQVSATLREIRRRMRKFGYLKVITDKQLNLGFAVADGLRSFSFARAHAAVISAIRPLHRLAMGVPTDIPVENLLWKFGAIDKRAVELDQSRCGLLFISPVFPLNGQFIAAAIGEMQSIAENYQHVLYVTVNIEANNALVAIINLLFDRSSAEEVERAHSCANALLAYIHNQGLELYRARADWMDKITAINPDYWKKIRALKQVFDPDNIIAPGRYNLP